MYCPTVHYFWSYRNSYEMTAKNLLANCNGIVEVDLQELMFFSMISIERTENRIYKKQITIQKNFKKKPFKKEAERSHSLVTRNKQHK